MSKFRKALVNNKGFTLIELLVVIAVLGILAAIAIPRLSGVSDKAKLSEGETILGTINNASNMYFTENSSWPDVSSQSDLSDDLDDYVDNFDNLLPDTGDKWFFQTSDSSNNTITIRHGDYTDDNDLELQLDLEAGSISRVTS